MKALAQITLKGPAQAIGLIVALALLGLLLPPVSLLSSALVALVCLQADSRNALLVLAASSALASLAGGLLAGMPLLGVALVAVFWAPVAAAAMLLRQSGQLSQALLVSAFVGMATVAFLNSIVADFDAAWTGVVDELLAQPSTAGLGTEDLDALRANLLRLGPLLPGLLGMSLMLSLQIALFIGRWMQSQVLKPGAFGNEYRQLAIGKAPSLVVAAVLAAAALTGEPVWQSLALVLGWLPVTQGIALMHAYAARENFRQARPLLILGWLLLIVLPHFVVLLAALGAVDNWLNFRGRWAVAANHDSESEP